MADATVQISITSVAELRAFQDTEKAIQRQIVAAKVAGVEHKELSSQLNRVQDALGRASGWLKFKSELLESSERIPILGSAMRMLNGAVGTASVAVGGLALALREAKHAVQEFAQAQQAVVRLDTALAQTGNLTEEYRQRLQELATQLQNTTGIADEQWLAVLTRLTQFGADPSNIEQYAEAVKNLAGLLGGDIQSAAMMFARAMQGNYTMFARYGIVVEDAGTQTEKLDLLMQQLALRGGGQLDNMGKTLTGRWNTLKAQLSDAMEGIGGAIVKSEIFQGVLESIANTAQRLARWLGAPIEKTEGLRNATVKTRQSLEETGTSAKKLADDGLKAVADQARDATTALERNKAALESVRRAQDEIADAELALKLAEVDNSDLSDLDKLKKKSEYRKEFAEQKFQRAQTTDQQKIAQNEATMTKGGYELAVNRERERGLYSELDQARAADRTEKGAQTRMVEARKAMVEADKRMAEAEKTLRGDSTGRAALKGEDGAVRQAETSTDYLGKAWREYETARAELGAQSKKMLAARDEFRGLQASRTVRSTSSVQADLTELVPANVQREKDQQQLADDKQRENEQLRRDLATRAAVHERTQKRDARESGVAVRKVEEEKQRKDADAAREEAARAEENKLREMELARAAPADLVAQRGRVAKARLPADATPEQRRAADLAGQEPSPGADKNDWYRRANNTSTLLDTAQQIQKQDLARIGVQGGETVAGAIKKAMEQMGVTLADTLSADDLARAIKGSTDSIAKSYSDLLTRLKDVEDRLRKGK